MKYYNVQVWPILKEQPEQPVSPVVKVVSENSLNDFLTENVDEDHYVVVSPCDVLQ